MVSGRKWDGKKYVTLENEEYEICGVIGYAGHSPCIRTEYS